jgi:hypothetical protein
MKRILTIFLALGIISGSVFSQAPAAQTSKLLSSTQAVLNSVINNPDMIVITGKMVDADTHEPITDAKINFNRFGDELVNAALDKDGNYALALNKKEIGEQVRITFKIEGYQKYVAKCVKKDKAVVDLDLFLNPDYTNNPTSANMKYTLNNDAFNTLVIKF